MTKLRLFVLLLIFLPAALFAQQKNSNSKSVNQFDAAGKKHGMWIYSVAPRMGEPGTNESGMYEHGNKVGVWYVIDDGGDLISSETYAHDVLDGEVKYYDRGQMYCRGSYRGLSPKQAYDTILIVDPITHDESYKVIATDRGSLRHGTWWYYDPLNGSLLKEEEYQVDELVFKKEYAVSQRADSLYGRWRNKLLPHKRGAFYTPSSDRQYHYIDVLKSD